MQKVVVAVRNDVAIADYAFTLMPTCDCFSAIRRFAMLLEAKQLDFYLLWVT
jgi:hypothetical protein